MVPAGVVRDAIAVIRQPLYGLADWGRLGVE